jgi:hypothetical protein
VAFFASTIFVAGLPIEPDVSIMMTCAAVGASTPARKPSPVALTVTTASTTRPSSGRYSFW